MTLLDAPKPTYGGTYRAVCLAVSPDRVRAQVPQVFGETVVTIFNFAGRRPAEGDEGWVVFESGRAEHPTWTGSESLLPELPPGGALGQVLTKESGADSDVGWEEIFPTGGAAGAVLTKQLDGSVAWVPKPSFITYPAFDVFFDIAGYNLGNRTAFAEYRLDGDMCDMRFTYVIGTTTGWPAHYVRIKTPFNMAAGINQRIPVGHVIAYDASTGLLIHGRAIMYSGDVGGTYLWGPRSFAGNGYTGSTENYWNQFSPPWPFRSGLDAAESWAANDQIMGTLRFRALLP